jgi:hypothetical protein
MLLDTHKPTAAAQLDHAVHGTNVTAYNAAPSTLFTGNVKTTG